MCIDRDVVAGGHDSVNGCANFADGEQARANALFPTLRTHSPRTTTRND